VFGTSIVNSECPLMHLKSTGCDVVVLWTIVNTSEVLEYEVSPDIWRAAKAIENISNFSNVSTEYAPNGPVSDVEAFILGHGNDKPLVAGLSESIRIASVTYLPSSLADSLRSTGWYVLIVKILYGKRRTLNPASPSGSIMLKIICIV
jgi:hypothetical protein